MIAGMRSDLPSGTVTFLFTDVEGSTRLLHSLGAEAYAEALAEHRRAIREACVAEGGVEVDTQGDALFYAFSTAPGALAAASAFTTALAEGLIRVRAGVHTGTPLLTDEGYVGADVHRAARIAAAGHGGQVLVSSTTAALVDLELRDLGEHRLKDLSAAERIYQLGRDDFPPLKSLYRTNLPVPATPFLGREAELADVVSLLTADGMRLVTLTGPGGTGKTRLALQAAAEASESFPDGIFWLPLAPLRDPDLVLPSLARTLAVTEEPGVALSDTLTTYLSGKSVLVLLDNVEHLLPPAAERIAALRASNGSLLLVTSRERLRIGGEQTWPVPPLVEDDGTALFVARARAVDPSFVESAAVAELCSRLDELPLAIELAAARTAVFSAAQLLERLSQRLDLLKGDRDADPRQQTLRATIEWSHELLAAEERLLFAQLAVFVGGCTYEAAEKVTSADADALQSLLDKSLLRKRLAGEEPRYWMLETIREYAVERLEASGEAEAARRRHAEYFLALAEEAEPHLSGGDPAGWLQRLEVEHDNVRAAYDELERRGETQLVLQLAGAVYTLWIFHGHLVEGRRRLDAALAADERPTLVRARALHGAGQVAGQAGDAVAEGRYLEEAIALFTRLGDERRAAISRYVRLTHWADEGNWEMLRRDAERSLEELEGLDDFYALVARRTVAWANEMLGDVDRYRELTEENLARSRALGYKRMEARALGGLATEALREGRLEDARAMFEESFRIDLDMGFSMMVAVDLVRLAAVSTAEGDPETAARLLARANALREEVGYSEELWMTEEREQGLASARSTLDDATFASAWDQGRRMTLADAVGLALGESVDEGDEPETRA
jgi:predicted ATPase/class 3 adenylate cyclase